jgi:hypothetical protein
MSASIVSLNTGTAPAKEEGPHRLRPFLLVEYEEEEEYRKPDEARDIQFEFHREPKDHNGSSEARPACPLREEGATSKRSDDGGESASAAAGVISSRITKMGQWFG